MFSLLYNCLLYVVDFFFPSYCVNCGQRISYKDNCLCKECIKNIDVIFDGCEVCSGELLDGHCAICDSRKIFFDKNIAIAEYNGVVKEILHSFKFNKRKRLHTHLSSLAFGKISCINDSIDAVTSVPINKKKRWERGFNQSELIAKYISKKIKVDYVPHLKEKYNFKAQKKLGYRDRFLNILDRFIVKNEKRLKGKNILIIDDIFTTGATINECARILKSFGAEKVYSLTIARAAIKRVDKFLVLV